MSNTVPRIEYTVQVWQERSQFVAHAMPLDVASAGRTPDEARQALDEAVRLFLKASEDMGTLSDVLAEAGYEPRNGEWVSPSWIGVQRHTVAIGV